MDEPELKSQLRKTLHDSFDLREEVNGQFLVDGTSVIIDFLAYPKTELIDRGFDPFWFGIEAKSPQCKDPKKKGLQVAWQTITYAQSRFDDIRPQFVLIFPPLEEFFPDNESHWLKCLLQKANVGDLRIKPNGIDWKIEFGAAGRYFSNTHGRSKTMNLGQRRVVGTWK